MKKQIWIPILIIIVIVVGALIYLSQKTEPEEKEVIKIGFIGPLTGDIAVWGQNQQKGIEIALEEINKDGELVEVIYEDTQCNGQFASQAATKLINIDKVMAIIGDTCSSATLAVSPIAENNKVVLISAVSGADSISEAGDYIFRNFLPNRYYSREAVKYMEENKIDKAAVLYINNDYGVNIARVFRDNFKGEIIIEEGYNEGTQDFRTILMKVKNNNPQIVFLAGYYPDGALLLKQRKELNIDIPFLGASDAYDDPKLIEIAGGAAEDFKYFTVPTGNGPKFNNFKKIYNEKYSEEPAVYSDFAHDTLMVIYQAVKKCDTFTTECIKNKLYETKYNGASNYVEFDENGDLVSSATVIKVIKDGESEIVNK